MRAARTCPGSARSQRHVRKKIMNEFTGPLRGGWVQGKPEVGRNADLGMDETSRSECPKRIKQ